MSKNRCTNCLTLLNGLERELCYDCKQATLETIPPVTPTDKALVNESFGQLKHAD